MTKLQDVERDVERLIHILGIIIPTDFHVFQKGRYTTQANIRVSLKAFGPQSHKILLCPPPSHGRASSGIILHLPILGRGVRFFIGVSMDWFKGKITGKPRI